MQAIRENPIFWMPKYPVSVPVRQRDRFWNPSAVLDLYLLVDVLNYSMTYSLCGNENHMSPDDHYRDLKRIIAAVGGKARRITVIMPFLYESRQHKRTSRESLDCALALQELVSMGVDNIITFDAHASPCTECHSSARL